MALRPIVEGLLTRPARGRAHLAPHLHRYLSGKLAATQWYPEADRLALATGLATSLGAGPQVGNPWTYIGRLWAWRAWAPTPAPMTPGTENAEDVTIELGDIDAEEGADQAFALRDALVPEDPGATLCRLAVLWSSLHDTGDLRVDMSEPTRARLELVGYAAATPEALAMLGGVLREAISLSGAGCGQIQVVRGVAHPTWSLRWPALTAVPTPGASRSGGGPRTFITEELDVDVVALVRDGEAA